MVLNSLDHSHSWIAFFRDERMHMLYVRCKCGGVGVVVSLNSDEWAQASLAATHPYTWHDPLRVEFLKKYKVVYDRRKDCWTLHRKLA